MMNDSLSVRIKVLLRNAAHPLPAVLIGDILGVWSGRLYPALVALERSGEIVSDWENGAYPRRRLYEIGPNGKA